MSSARNVTRATAARRVNPVVIESMESRQMMSLGVSYVPVTISDAAKAADPTLANLRTVDVQFTVSGKAGAENDDWIAASFDITLTKGSFYNPRLGGNTANPALWSVLPYVQFDTFVAGPSFGNVNVLGSTTFSPTKITINFGDLDKTGNTTFTAARLTFTPDAVGTLSGKYTTLSNTNETSFSTTLPFKGVITGAIYADNNGNGKLDGKEKKLPSWQAYIDTNNNGKLDTGERSVKTSGKGVYTFTGLEAGSYRIRITLKDGFIRTGKTSYSIAVESATLAAKKDFGVFQVGRISGNVFFDSNGNGAQENGEGGMTGYRIYIDQDNDGKFDSTEPFRRSDSSGGWGFEGMTYGTYNIRITATPGLRITTPTNGLYTITVNAGDNKFGNVFGQKPM